MYRLYSADCSQRKVKPVSEALYRKIFHRDFNLKFKEPQKDTCTRCDSFKVQLAALQQQKGDDVGQKIKDIESKIDSHQRSAQLARDALITDRLEAKDSSKTASVITFDLQSTLPTPSMSTNVVYYKSNLWYILWAFTTVQMKQVICLFGTRPKHPGDCILFD